MFCLLGRARAFAFGLLMTLLSFSYASAHCYVGARFFPATLATDDPCVADEMSLPTVSWFKTGDNPPASEVDISVDISKRITEDFEVTIGDSWSQVRQPGNPTLAGFGNLETTFQYQLMKDASHEFAMLVGLEVDWGGTGNTGAGLATSYSVLTPTFNFGQGFGQLPETLGWARPLAVTGQIGYQIPTMSFDVGQAVYIPQVLVYGGTLQYSMPYLKSEVKDLGLPDLINHLIPIVEAQFATPVANNLGNSFVTTGTINPGVIWVGSHFQVGLEAVIPVNRDSGIGFLGQVHLYLDDIFPRTYGQPLIGGISSSNKPNS